MVPAMWAFLGYIRKLVRRREADPRDDLISALVHARDAGDRLSESQDKSGPPVGMQNKLHLLARRIVEKDDDHRGANEMIVEIAFKKTGLCQCVREIFHHHSLAVDLARRAAWFVALPGPHLTPVRGLAWFGYRAPLPR